MRDMHADPIVGGSIPACQISFRSATGRYAWMMPSRHPRALLVIAALLFTPVFVAHADDSPKTEAPVSNDGNTFGEAIKRDSKAVGATFKEGAHRVAVASKAVAHEIATAAKRGAAETRAAFRGEKASKPAP